MAAKMLIDRVDELENELKKMWGVLALSSEFMELISKQLPQYDVLLKHRKLALSKAKAMRLAKQKKRHEIADRKEAVKNAR